jgi:hypothetical protein
MMGQVKPDFSNAQDFTPVPDDVYTATITAVDEFKSKSTNTPMLEVEFEIMDSKKYLSSRKDAGGKQVELNTQGRKLYRNVPLAGKGAGFLRTFLEAVKIPEDKFDNTTQLMGKRVKVKTGQEEYEGQTRSRIQAFVPA